MSPLTIPISAPATRTMRIASRYRQLVLHNQSCHQHAVQAGGVTDGEIEFADDDRHGQAAGDDHCKGRLVQHVDEVAVGGERARRQERENHDHHHQSDDGSVSRKDTKSCLGCRRQAPGCIADVAHAGTLSCAAA
jgi:hypothetical protein